MNKKTILIIITIVFIFIFYFNRINTKKSGFSNNIFDKTQKTNVPDYSLYTAQALQAKDDHLGTYKNEESTWTDLPEGVVENTGLSSGKIRKDERTGLWWSASSLSTTITNRLDIVETDGIRITGGDAVAFCDGLNAVAFGGKTDWYLPTQKELMQAYIDGIYSQDPNFGTTNNFWSSTEQLSYNPKLIWYANVHTGDMVDFIWSTHCAVRCVRREDSTLEKSLYTAQALQAKDDHLGTYKNEESTWTDLPEGVVENTGLSSGKIRKDERTGLWWSASSLSTTITNRLDIVETDGIRITGGDAVAFCDGLNAVAFGGKTDWYLPTQKELIQAFIDGIYSQDHEFGTSNAFWSSTELSSDPKNTWFVGLSYGFAFFGDESESYAVRCVRRD